MRAVVTTIIAAAVAVLAALISGEYELNGPASLVAGLGIGLVVGQVFAMGQWRGLFPATLAALLAAGSMAWAGWIDSGQGLYPYPPMVWSGVAVAAATAVASVGRWRGRPQRAVEANASR